MPQTNIRLNLPETVSETSNAPVNALAVYFWWEPKFLNVRFWPKADVRENASNVAFGGKADIAYCSANVCL